MMSDEIETLANAVAYRFIEVNKPELLQSIGAFLAGGFSPDEIVEWCAARTGQPAARVAFIGCAAAHLLEARDAWDEFLDA